MFPFPFLLPLDLQFSLNSLYNSQPYVSVIKLGLGLFT